MEQENNINIGLSIPDIMDKESEENRTFESGEKKKKGSVNCKDNELPPKVNDSFLFHVPRIYPEPCLCETRLSIELKQRAKDEAKKIHVLAQFLRSFEALEFINPSSRLNLDEIDNWLQDMRVPLTHTRCPVHDG